MADLIGQREWKRHVGGESGADVFCLGGSEGDDLYLKYGTDDVADAIVDEAVRLRWLSKRLPCPDTIALVTQGNEAWLLTTALSGKTGDAWLEQNPAMLPCVINAFARFLRQLHGLPVEDCPFDAGSAVRLAAARRAVAAGLVDIGDFGDDHAGLSATEMLEKTEALAVFDASLAVTHGDFSLGNLLLDEHGEVIGAIDLGRLGVADRYQDIAIFWQNLADYGSRAQAQFLAAIGVTDVDEQRLKFHRCLDELF
nr:APH(3') family aminoglycoside O-phosphotransferase [Sphingomonas sp. 3P27F8]